jgi:X-linked retinitis pigmentosa GTPase regulator
MSPVKLADIAHIKMKHIAAGSCSASISSDSGDLYLWGSGVFGEFLTPHRVKTISNRVVGISLGNQFGAAINSEGLVYTWGRNSNGELGSGFFEERATP